MAAENILQGIPDTTYIPLVARIYVSRRFPEYFHDEKALSLEPAIPTEAIRANSSEYECIASAARSHVIDGMVAAFLGRHPNGNVDAMMHFGLDDPEGFAKRAGCELLERSGFYDDARKLGRRLVLRTRLFMYFSDKWGRTLVVHMRLVAK